MERAHLIGPSGRPTREPPGPPTGKAKRPAAGSATSTGTSTARRPGKSESDPDTEPTRLPGRLAALRHHLRQLPRFVLPALLTCAMYLCFFFLDFLSGFDLAVFGVRDAATEQRVLARYGQLILNEQVRILATYAALGILTGVTCQMVTVLWERSGAWPAPPSEQSGDEWPGYGERPWPLHRRIFMTLGIAVGFHLWQLCHAIARFPQIFAESLYDRGGVRRALMLTLTHVIPSSLVDGLFLGAAVGLVLGPVISPHGRRWLLSFSPARLGRIFTASRPRYQAMVGAALLVASGALWLRGQSGPRTDGRAAPEGPVQGATPTTAPATATLAPADQPSVLLIAVDSLRADRVGPQARVIAPHIAAFSERSVRFDAAYVTVPRTFPSFVTILTGRYPHHHGIRTMFPSAGERAAAGPALPGLLRKEGFSTQVLSDFCGEIFSRIDLGFSDVRVPYFDAKAIIRQRSVQVHPNLLPYVDGAAGRRLFPALDSLAELSDPDLLADRTIRALSRHQKDGKPFFTTVFFSTAHFPYAAPAPFYRRFTDPNYRGPFRYHKPPWADAQMTPEDEQQVRALYNGAVAATDAAIDRVLQSLEQSGLDKKTIVVLLADHGENLYDEAGRGMGHGDHLEGGHSLQIPLLIFDPVHRFPAHVVPGIVRDVDLAPTLLALVSPAGEAPDVPMDGVDLLPLLKGDRQTLGLHALSETELWFTPAGPGFEPDDRLPYPGITATTDIDPSDDIFLSERWRDLVTVAKHRALRTDRWKLIYRPTRSGVHWSLYDAVADPTETRDVQKQYPREFSSLQSELLRFLADDPKAVVEGGYVLPR